MLFLLPEVFSRREHGGLREDDTELFSVNSVSSVANFSLQDREPVNTGSLLFLNEYRFANQYWFAPVGVIEHAASIGNFNYK